MPGIVAGALVAHPPILVPEVGGSESQRVSATADAMRQLDLALSAVPASLVIMVSPHSPASSIHVPVRRALEAAGDLRRFRAPQVRVQVRIDLETAEAIVSAASQAGFPLAWTADSELDHGVVVPLSFLERTRHEKSFVFLGISAWPLRQFIDLGAWLHQRLATRSAIFLASGDLSHGLTAAAPAGFRPEGQVFDELVIGALRDHQWERIENLDPNFIEAAGECGLRPLAMLLGASRAAGLSSRVLSYEGPFGVGYPVVHFTRERPYDLQALGRSAIEHYLRHREFIEPPLPIPAELQQPSAVFVTLRAHGEVRGCVGSLKPTEPTAAHEFIRYAVSSAVRDPRFDPVRLDEVPHLSVKVQLLDPPEPISDVKALDPAQYGLIVRSGDRHGLLLPGIDQVETPEQQVSAACDKAGISPSAPIEMLRFRATTIE